VIDLAILVVDIKDYKCTKATVAFNKKFLTDYISPKATGIHGYTVDILKNKYNATQFEKTDAKNISKVLEKCVRVWTYGSVKS
tara:strand:+ start:580 stop:828 length:249 start_codon:yes stop_codon:yes gene_type:complete